MNARRVTKARSATKKLKNSHRSFILFAMQKPCDSDTCLPSFDRNCPGSDDECHHCDSCGKLCGTEGGAYCYDCQVYWCDSCNYVFQNPPLCSHLRAEKTNQETSVIERELNAGLCPHCFFRRATCIESNCKFNPEQAIKKWEEFIVKPVKLCVAKLSQANEEESEDSVKLSIVYERIILESLENCITWPLDQSKVWLYVNHQPRCSFEEPNAFNKACEKANEIIKRYKKDGFGIERATGPLQPKSWRDRSPVRSK